MTASPTRSDHRISLRLESACEFTAVRAAVAQAGAWLAEKNLSEAELGAWELALVEATNNAVKYADAAARGQSVVIEISAGERDIEARVTDHTAGFDWPKEIKLPEDDAEGGRGLYLMKSLTEEVFYLRHPGQNVLVLRRARPAAGGSIFPDTAQLQQRLADAETALTDMTSELSTSYESLVALFRYSSMLGTQTDLGEFSRRLMHDLMKLAEADGAVLRLVSVDGKKLETKIQLPEKSAALPPVVLGDEILRSVETAAARTRQDIWFSPEEPLDKSDPLRAAMPVGTGICHAFHIADQLVGTVALGRLAAHKPFTAAQVNLLHTFVDFLAIQLINARLLEERTATRVTRRELEIAADIQRSLLPAQLPACAPFTLAASCRSALQVGGDFFDAIAAPDGAALLVIADVMGKGVPAALFAAVLRTTIRSMPQLFAQPGELLGAANQILFTDLSRVDMFITAAVAYVNPRRGEIVAASAGHCPLLLAGGGAARAGDPKNSGLPLGIDGKVFYPQITHALPPGGAALLYTDGLTETRNPAGEMLGDQQLLALLAEALHQSADAERAKMLLLERLAAYRGGAALADDETFMLIRNQK
ncbi:MAG: SpoIIE family protein phosphatase [Verrucomicrobiae bacterium]|nr:SpoIIE family protein phosphatase [Verrucomicrobiae bacterium]